MSGSGGYLWPVDATIAGLVDTNFAWTGRTLVTGLVDAGTASAIAMAMRTTHLLNLMVKGMISENIKGDQRERSERSGALEWCTLDC